MPGLTRRSAEWSLLVIVILVLMGVFAHRFRVVQGQGELAAIKTTLGALRTALVLDHLHTAVVAGGQSVATTQRNPFLLLDHVPANYAGVLGDVQPEAVSPGKWVFDAYCACIGYAPLYPYATDGAGDVPMVWFLISAPPGPLHITPLHAYRWQGELIN